MDAPPTDQARDARVWRLREKAATLPGAAGRSGAFTEGGMSIIELGALGEFIGAIAVVVTLAYLAIQIRQNT